MLNYWVLHLYIIIIYTVTAVLKSFDKRVQLRRLHKQHLTINFMFTTTDGTRYC